METLTNGNAVTDVVSQATSTGSRGMGKLAIGGIIVGAAVATAVGIYGVIKLLFKKDQKSDEKKDDPKGDQKPEGEGAAS